eukprot:6176143-Pleurochrysis_carterae.AAC.2
MGKWTQRDGRRSGSEMTLNDGCDWLDLHAILIEASVTGLASACSAAFPRVAVPFPHAFPCCRVLCAAPQPPFLRNPSPVLPFRLLDWCSIYFVSRICMCLSATVFWRTDAFTVCCEFFESSGFQRNKQ